MSNDIPDGPLAAQGNPSEPAAAAVAPKARTVAYATRDSDDLLTVEQRSALLRAARRMLSNLHDDCEAVHQQGDQLGRLNALLSEISTLEEAIAWLWRFTIAP
jgi:hypothetical protein